MNYEDHGCHHWKEKPRIACIRDWQRMNKSVFKPLRSRKQAEEINYRKDGQIYLWIMFH